VDGRQNLLKTFHLQRIIHRQTGHPGGSSLRKDLGVIERETCKETEA
jgi:hypothetical protein